MHELDATNHDDTPYINYVTEGKTRKETRTFEGPRERRSDIAYDMDNTKICIICKTKMELSH